MISIPADTFYLRTFGCQMNEHDSERIAGLLEGMGMEPVGTPDEAGLLAYNTCSIREKADTRLLGHLGEAKRLKDEDPARLIVVAGCLAQSRQQSFFREHPYVDVLVGPQSLEELPGLLMTRLEQDAQAGSFRMRAKGWSADLPRAAREGPHAWVQVMTGCTNFCAYCIVPYVRGPEASRLAADIVAEVEELVATGVREVTLLGQNVNAYGKEADFGGSEDFARLLAMVSEVPGLDRVRFMTSHPKDLSPELIKALVEIPEVCGHLHLPVQSGSDRILADMGRGYGRADYLSLVSDLRAAAPRLTLTTDIIVGFPGETEAEFQETLTLVEECGFDSAFTFVYSPREGTRAASLPGRVDSLAAEGRMQRLVAAVQRQARLRNEELVGQVLEVMVAGPSRNDASECMGRTRGFKVVNFPGDFPPGELIDVDIIGATSTSLRGRVHGGRR